MFASEAQAEEILDAAVSAIGNGSVLYAALDELPAAIYVTDANGFITYFNPPCIDFAGRTPVLGQDRWCVTWKLYTDKGEFLPHDECPMAVAIKTKNSVRGVIAEAERPDGTRVTFLPYPTPLLDEHGKLLGAINMLIDVTDSRQASLLEAQARKCRRLALSVNDEQATENLNRMAVEYEQKACALRKT